MSRDRIIEIINQVSEQDDFTGGVDDSEINKIESALNIKLPESYKWFIKEYGHGGIGGLEILGVSKAKIPSCVKETQKYRQYGLPEQFVVIENCDEWLYCLDISQFIDGECRVVDWDRKGNIGIRGYKNFEEFLEDRFKDALENM